MGWNSQQNPTGYSSAAIRPIGVDPATLEPALTDAQKSRQVLYRAPKIPAALKDLPIAANARKVDGFAPTATSAGQ